VPVPPRHRGGADRDHIAKPRDGARRKAPAVASPPLARARRALPVDGRCEQRPACGRPVRARRRVAAIDAAADDAGAVAAARVRAQPDRLRRIDPVTSDLIRHDHVHLDLIVDGRKVVVPAGVGQIEPVDRGPGPCPPPPENLAIGDCAPGHFFTPNVAFSPLHPHSTSGIVHIESDRKGAFTLGQFFDEWRVRFTARCLGSYCSGRRKALRVFVDGRRVARDPRRLVLLDRQEIAVVFGDAGAFGSVPSTYTKRWPIGCGGPGERACVS